MISDPTGDGDRGFAAIGRPPRVLVIGYGNPLRSDDAIGPRVVRELRGRADASLVEAIERLQLVPEIMEQIRKASLVVFVDAASQGAPGSWLHHRLRPGKESGSFSHGSTPDALLALASSLYGVTPEAHLFTISGKEFGFGEDFSPETLRAFPQVVAEIEHLIAAAVNGDAAG